MAQQTKSLAENPKKFLPGLFYIADGGRVAWRGASFRLEVELTKLQTEIRELRDNKRTAPILPMRAAQ